LDVQGDDIVVFIINKLAVVVVGIARVGADCTWSYATQNTWATDCPSTLCGGAEQSPLALSTSLKDTSTDCPLFYDSPSFLEPIGVNWNSYSQVKLVKDAVSLTAVVPTTLGVGEEISTFFGGRTNEFVTWELTNYEIHIPAEHTVDGKQADMEVVFWHHRNLVGTAHDFAAVSFLFSIETFSKPKYEPTFLNPFIAAASILQSSGTASAANFFFGQVYIDFRADLYRRHKSFEDYFTYDGSFATPATGCDETVHRYVFASTSSITQDQHDKVSAIIGAPNARSPQPPNCRTVYAFNAAGSLQVTMALLFASLLAFFMF